MLFADVVATSGVVAATRARSRKIEAIAELLRRVDLDELPVAVALLTGEPRQGRIGVGWATVSRLEAPAAAVPSLEILDVDRALDRLAAITGPGSQATRTATLHDLLSRSTSDEQWFLRRLLVGELRQGALAGVVTDAVAKAAGVPLAALRRAAMLAGDLPRVAVLARRDGPAGLDAVRLSVLRPVQPMLAQTADDVAGALAVVGGEASVEWKLDGARIQVHRDGDEVRVYTRNLNDVTDRLPAVVALAGRLPVQRIVLDGEAVGWGEGEQPELFQATMSRFSRRNGARDGDRDRARDRDPDPDQDPDGASGASSTGAPAGAGTGGELDAGGRGVVGGDGAELDSTTLLVLEARFFDCLHLDGDDLLDQPLTARRAALERVVGRWLVPGRITADPETAQAVLDEALAAGHEGVMVKAAGSAYEAGRRGGAWRKVKPVRTLDLVVLAAEWGHGRRQGWLSNLHLGARDPDGGGFVMVGKTFKGLTDELLAWQTETFRGLAVGGTSSHVVRLRPELVVEVALDGVQRSPRYAGGVALRFARVRRYRPDKTPDEADTIDAVRALLPGRRG